MVCGGHCKFQSKRWREDIDYRYMNGTGCRSSCPSRINTMSPHALLEINYVPCNTYFFLTLRSTPPTSKKKKCNSTVYIRKVWISTYIGNGRVMKFYGHCKNNYTKKSITEQKQLECDDNK